MNKFPLIVSYYTKDTLYQLEVQNLIASCEKWGLEHHIEPIASLGSWERNCCYKPFFLMEKLQQFKRPLFWVDADAVFVKEPEWLAVFDKDMALRINGDLEDSHPSKVCSGSLYINANLTAATLLKLWGQACIDAFLKLERTEEIWDQMILRDVLLRGGLEEAVAPLPLEYAAIADQICNDAIMKEPVIIHYQASRRFKKIINN